MSDRIVVGLSFHRRDVRVRGGLVVHPRIGTTGYTVSSKTGFTIGSVRFVEIEQADEFAKRVRRFKEPWATMTLKQWAEIRPRLGERLHAIAVECGWDEGRVRNEATP